MMFNMTERILGEYFKTDHEIATAKERLSSGEPLAYIVGETVFYDEVYKVDRSTLIPRPDTERVVDMLMKILPPGGRFADLCSGCGNIAISALRHTSGTTALLCDLSKGAVELSKINAVSNGVADRCDFIEGDIRELDLPGKFDVIVSNPPYVRTSVIPALEKECSFEPYAAFDGGEDGMDFYRVITDRFQNSLKDNGYFLFEIGFDEREAIVEIAKNTGFEIEVYKDYGSNDRVALLKRRK